MEVGNVNIQGIMNSLRKGDSRTEVGKVLEQLHKDIKAIMDKTDVKNAEDLVKLKKLASKIGDAIKLLKSGGNMDQVADMLQSIKNETDDPDVQSTIGKIRDVADKIRQNKVKMLSVNNSGSNSVV